MHKKVLAFLKHNAVLLVVFFTGAVVLAVEVMAVRILSPYFGNTIYSFSSVVSVILAALSLGYWRGGVCADRDPEEKNFYKIVSMAGVAVVLTQVFSVLVLAVVFRFFSILTGPLIASCILFFYPSYLFGQLSPFAVKLRAVTRPDLGVGKVSGEVFFVSTLGSIFGSLFSGFFLVPYVGISTSMVLMGVLVFVVGMSGLFRAKGVSISNYVFSLVVVCICSVSVVSWFEPVSLRSANVLYASDGLYQHVSVEESQVSESKTARILVLDRAYSSGITLPDRELLFPYTWYYTLYELFDHPADLENALVLGAGTGTVGMKIVESYAGSKVDIVDIEPELFTLAHEYFFMPYSDSIKEYVADGRRFLKDSEKQYGLIFGDMYSSLSVPWHVATKEYYELLRDRLTDDGVYVGNYIASLAPENRKLFGSTLRTLREVFENVYVFAVVGPDVKKVQNVIFLATKRDDVYVTKEMLESQQDMRMRFFATTFVPYEPEFIENAVIFTDDLSPMDMYLSEITQ